MSSSFQPKNKELAKVRVVSSDQYNKNRKYLSFVGSVRKSLSNFITTKRNKTTGKCSFIEDTSALTKKAKGDMVRFFSDKNNKSKKVAYLVVPKVSNNKLGSKKLKRNKDK